jgi:hypothetical protein
MAVPTTIITKFGNGKPKSGDLQHGELAIDMTNSILYTKEGNGLIIQLGGGDVNWNQIIGVPEQITNIIDVNADGYIDLAALKALVEQHTGEIAQLDTDLKALAVRVTTNETNIGTNSDRIDALEDQAGGDGGFQEQINDILDQITIINGRLDVVETLADNNKGEIDTIKDLLDANLVGLVFGGEYNADINVVEKATDAGKAAGLTDGQNVPGSSAQTKGIYLIVTTAGELTGTTKSDGDQANVGDWLVSDGIHGWLHLELGQGAVTFSMIEGSARDNADLEAELDKKMDAEGATINCGNY